MANKYFINLPEKTTPEDSNILPIEDSQDTKRITLANLKTAILGNRTYTEQNVVTNGESITKSINELDIDLASHKAENAAHGINTKLPDQVDISSTLVNGWVLSHVAENGLRVVKAGKMVNLVGGIMDGAVTSGTQIGTIPAGYRLGSGREIYAIVYNIGNSATDKAVLVRITSAGHILVANRGVSWSPGICYFNVTYPIV